MLDNYPRALANTLVEEGGWSNHPSDPGGPTMRGVIQRTYDAYRDRTALARRSVRHIGETELKEIYWSGYAKPIRFGEWPKGPDQIAFDIAVNSGPGRTWSIATSVLGQGAHADIVAAAASAADKAALVKTLCARRAAFYRNLKTFATFGTGWMRRNARMEAIGVKMALEAAAAGAGPADVERRLEDEKARAEAAANKAGKGAAGTGMATGGTGGGAAQVDAGAWDWSAIVAVGLILAALAGATVLLTWLWRRHGERAKAYALAARGEIEASLADIMPKLGG
jgi:lysozyme family protein